MNIPDRAADVAAGVSGTATLFGVTVAQINQYLQAGAFIVAIISGIFAARYYWKKANEAKP